ncbi:alpha/beta hydrolase family protein [Yoonia sediminilitoris]|uniref:Platelet-activating factor acetylhydrolase isoform II n=1 Tax=Yoonia sediminilitoris TaxID=1286148 RepID=A0A2T6KQC0_9RHOB|nr:alpha/beta fold hydrolase [Yoonia sediminilitoris]PUB18750.1 platelet-activating factor acetylhydrolase isoform II [Yoonia sediminilitoris]RCW98918.1 platelet-activating factor acetylhydrolase isoform II [Yoonia sediminilitoris]
MRALPTALGLLAATAASAENRIDIVRPDAPELAHYGDHKIGVTTLQFTNRDQIDVVNTEAEGDIARYDRTLTVEVWYPAKDSITPGGTMTAIVRDGVTKATLTGQAARDADPDTSRTFPLVIISHGYPGNRFLMSPLGENLASKGYVVASIDHRDSTYDDQTAFGSTLVNRPWDQRFVIDRMGALEGDLGQIIQSDNIAIIGYSMGGYGALIYAGAGVTQASTEYSWGAPQGLLERNMMGTDSHAQLQDPRVKAFVAFGPWGNNTGFWDADSWSGIEKPLMLIAGSVDDVSIYDAIRGIFDDTKNTRRHLLTFENANHNAGAPMPAPVETYDLPAADGWFPFGHYADAVWDTTRMNNVSQHFVTGYLDLHLKGDEGKAAYFDLVPDGNAAVWSHDDAGNPTDDHTYWKGFRPRSAFGLRFETKSAGE